MGGCLISGREQDHRTETERVAEPGDSDLGEAAGGRGCLWTGTKRRDLGMVAVVERSFQSTMNHAPDHILCHCRALCPKPTASMTLWLTAEHTHSPMGTKLQ